MNRFFAFLSTLLKKRSIKGKKIAETDKDVSRLKERAKELIKYEARYFTDCEAITPGFSLSDYKQDNITIPPYLNKVLNEVKEKGALILNAENLSPETKYYAIRDLLETSSNRIDLFIRSTNTDVLIGDNNEHEWNKHFKKK